MGFFHLMKFIKVLLVWSKVYFGHLVAFLMIIINEILLFLWWQVQFWEKLETLHGSWQAVWISVIGCPTLWMILVCVNSSIRYCTSIVCWIVLAQDLLLLSQYRMSNIVLFIRRWYGRHYLLPKIDWSIHWTVYDERWLLTKVVCRLIEINSLLL